MLGLLRVVVTSTAVAFAGTAHAGGSYERVKVKSFRVVGDTKYELVVETPIQPRELGYPDPYFAKCRLFTVHGKYFASYAVAHFPPEATRQSHLEAMETLRAAQASGKSISLGWIGTGFVPVDRANPCIVRSRALTVMRSPEGESAVVSFHDAP
jgi:hypothetical protein